MSPASMKVEYINPFLESVNETFQSMLGATVRRGDVGVSRGQGSPREISAFIGMSGPARGTVCLAFPSATAMKLVGRFLDQDIVVMNEDVVDGVSEIVNIVAGSAKAKLGSGGGVPIELGLPTVVRGNNYTVEYASNTVWLEVPFESDLGEFTLRVTFEFKEKRGNSA